MTDTPDPAPAPDAAPTPQPAPSGAPASSRSLVERAKNILTRPAAEWAAVEPERATLGGLLTGYILPLAAIPPLAFLLGIMVLGGAFASFVFGMFAQMAIVFYLVLVAVTVGLGFAIDALAPSFGAAKGNAQGLKLAAYASTPLFVGGVILFLPQLYWLWLLGGLGYGAYLLYLGLPLLMRPAQDKAPVFVAATIGIWIALLFFGRLIASSMMGFGGVGMRVF